MTLARNISLGGILLALFAAAAAAGAPVASCPAPDPSTGRYYLVTRPDPRLCPSPTCGGWFVREVNKPKSLCADGTWQSECHASQLDVAALGWTDEDRARFDRRFGKRHALARGRLEQRDFGGTPGDVLVVEEGWMGQALSRPAGVFFGLVDNGIVCITAPCASIDERRLNSASHRAIAEVDLAASGASAEQVAAGQEAMARRPGILAVGRNEAVEGPGGTGTRLAAREFYRLLAAKAEGQACGGGAGACPAGQFCDAPKACGNSDAAGVCVIPPQVCPQIYAPVCGCDGVTYANDCERQGAMVPLDHDGACTP
jgi:hypothetical protein